MWYSFDRILSYNALINFVMSPRGNGKTYGAKVRGIKRFLKTGEQFMYVRRTEKQLKSINTFFDDVAQDFPNHKFTVQGRHFYINGKLAGFNYALSTSQNLKSVPFPNVTTLIFDEFIIDKRVQRYLPNEVEIFLDLVNTVVRSRDNLRVLLLANNVSRVNPYFTYFKCIPKVNERFTLAHNGNVVVECFESVEYTEKIQGTKFGQLISGTRYGDFAINNKSLRDSNTFIDKRKPKDSQFVFSVTFNGTEIGFHLSYDEGLWFVNNEVDKNSKRRYAITKEDHDINLVMYNNLNNFTLFKEFVRFYREGYVRFKNINIKTSVYDIMAYMNVK